MHVNMTRMIHNDGGLGKGLQTSLCMSIYHVIKKKCSAVIIKNSHVVRRITNPWTPSSEL